MQHDQNPHNNPSTEDPILNSKQEPHQGSGDGGYTNGPRAGNGHDANSFGAGNGYDHTADAGGAETETSAEATASVKLFSGGVVTTVESDHGPVSKSFSLASDGVTVIGDGSGCSIRSGFIRRVFYSSASDFATIIGTMPSHTAVMLGALKPQFIPAGNAPAKLVAKALLGQTPGAVARTKETCEFAPGPGMMLLDIDSKAMPPEVAEKVRNAGGVHAVLCGIVNEMADAAHVVRASTSAGLSANGVDLSKGGINQHFYVAVEDMSDVPRSVEALHARLIIKGYGWVYIARNGTRLVRTLIDLAVRMPNGLAFEGAPVLTPPLVQDAAARQPVATEGPALDTRKTMPGLSGVERRLLEIAVANLRRGKAGEARVIAKAFDEEMAKKHAKRSGRPVETERRRVRRHRLGKLPPEWELEFDDPAIGIKTVAQVVVNAAIYEGETLADPIEGVSYGRGKAMVMLDRDGDPFIHSFAHGGAVYRLAIDEADIEKVIANTPPDAVIEVVRKLIGRLAGGIDAAHRLIMVAGKRAGIGRAAAKSALADVIDTLKRDEERLDADDKSEKGEARDAALGGADDGKIQISAPAPDAERGEMATLIDCILSEVDAAEPPMRNAGGQLVQIVERQLTGTHQLRDNDDYEGDTGEDEEEPEPSPPEPRMVPCASDVTMQMLIEPHITFLRVGKDGYVRSVALDAPFCRALNEMAPSKMALCRGVSRLPIILVSGRGRARMFAVDGLDRTLGVVFRIPAGLRKELESLAANAVTGKEMRAAYEWLRDVWLADVLTDENGKAILIAMLLTILQRFNLDELPYFMMSGAHRGTGKTTAVNMVAAAALGCRASASPWSGLAEERRKALYSFYLEGGALLVFDNLRRGMLVSDDTLAMTSTTGRIRDRKLGDSESPEVDARGVVAMTGNRIAPKGDLASRFLVAEFKTDRPDPENRDVTRLDPVGWTLKNRTKVLAAAVTLLLGARDTTSQPSRFKQWWRQAGCVIEQGSGGVVEFGELLRLSEEDEPEAVGASLLFKTILDKFGDGWLTTAQILALFDQSFWVGQHHWDGPPKTGDDLADAAAQAEWNEKKSMPDSLREALEEASGRGQIKGEMTPNILGQRLKSAAGRTVDIEGVGTVTLEGQIDKHTKRAVWRVVVLKADMTAKIEEFKEIFGEAAFEEYKELFGL